MIHMTINFVPKSDADKPHWPGLTIKETIHINKDIKIAVLEAGMGSGLPSLALRLDLPDGRTVVAETSARLFVGLMRVLVKRYPNIMD